MCIEEEAGNHPWHRNGVATLDKGWDLCQSARWRRERGPTRRWMERWVERGERCYDTRQNREGVAGKE